MRVVSADIYDLNIQPDMGVRPVILRLSTDEGIYGLGEVALAYGTGREAAMGMLKEMVKEFILGADPFPVDALWNTIYRRTFWGQGGGPVHYGAMSAIDHALWDIKGKALGVPVYELMGGKTRDKVRVYANGWSRRRETGYTSYARSPKEWGEAAQLAVADGFNALKFDPFFVDLEGGRRHIDRHLPREYAKDAIDRVRAVREAVGPDVDILIEVHGNLGTTDAIAIGRELVQFRPFFYEEPVDAMNVESMRKVAENVPIPIAAGERLYTRYGFRSYIEKQAIDILQPDLGLAGGISEVKKIAAHAETYNLHVQPHNCGGPVVSAASLQLDASITNFIIQEWFPYRSGDFLEFLENPLEPTAVNSEVAIPTEPGLGIRINEVAAKRWHSMTLAL